MKYDVMCLHEAHAMQTDETIWFGGRIIYLQMEKVTLGMCVLCLERA